MTPAEQEQARALLTRALSDPNWRTASQALDDLMRKLLVVHRLLESEERLAKRQPGTDPCNGYGPDHRRSSSSIVVRVVLAHCTASERLVRG
jgi:hypothetical protein